MAESSHYSKQMADFAVMFIEQLCHTKGTWAGKPFELIDWQERIIRDLFGTLKPNGYRQFNTAYIEIPKKMGKSELAAAANQVKPLGEFTLEAVHALSGAVRGAVVNHQDVIAPIQGKNGAADCLDILYFVVGRYDYQSSYCSVHSGK